jgi:Uma2 family endonuclease
MSSTDAETRLTAEQYLAFERKSEFRHEFVNGRIVAMAGASRRHNLISMNLSREISAQLRDRPCEAYAAYMRVKVSEAGRYTYLDLVVVCGEPRFEDSELDTLENPTLIIQILSPSTEAEDRGSRFADFRRLESLREYVLVAQDRVLVERFARQGDDWVLTELNRPDEVLRLPSVGCEVALSEVYAKVRFEEA